MPVQQSPQEVVNDLRAFDARTLNQYRGMDPIIGRSSFGQAQRIKARLRT